MLGKLHRLHVKNILYAHTNCLKDLFCIQDYPSTLDSFIFYVTESLKGISVALIRGIVAALGNALTLAKDWATCRVYINLGNLISFFPVGYFAGGQRKNKGMIARVLHW